MSAETWKIEYTEGFVPLPRADLPLVQNDASGRPAGLCIGYRKGGCTLAGYCPNRDKRDKTRCMSRGKASWCALALRGRV